MRIPLNQNGGENAAQAALLFKALNPHRTGIRQFIAREAKHFFAQRFGGKEAFAEIGSISQNARAARRRCRKGSSPPLSASRSTLLAISSVVSAASICASAC